MDYLKSLGVRQVSAAKRNAEMGVASAAGASGKRNAEMGVASAAGALGQTTEC